MPVDRRHTSPIRKLAAIMFTDIVGYTTLMGKDEDKAFQILDQNVDLHRTLIEKYKGKFLKQIGDGILASFSSTYNAVLCAKDIIKTTMTETEFQIRIGIHEGDVVFKGNDVYGDGVNIASRLQEEADDGCICISEVIYKNIKNKRDINVEFLEEKVLKNVDHPIKIYTLKEGNQDIKISKISISEESELPSKSIIVLPFENISPDPDQEYFSDGLTEEIITDLSFIHDLLVISRNSSMTFKGSKYTTKEIAKKVNVHYVLEGSVRKVGNNIRIVAQLIDGMTDSHLWAEKYNGKLDDVFDIQEKVSRLIADSLKMKLSATENEKISNHPIQNTQAYDCYLKAQHEIWNWTEESFDRALKHFENGLEIIGENALIYVGIGYVYWNYVNLGYKNEEYLNKAEEYVNKAFKLEPGLQKGYLVLGLIYNLRGDQIQYFHLLKKSFDLDQNDPNTLLFLSAGYMLIAGRSEASMSLVEKMIEIDPLDPNGYATKGLLYYVNGQFTNALESFSFACNMITNISPFWLFHYSLILVLNNHKDDAFKMIYELERTIPKDNFTQFAILLKSAVLGDKTPFKSLDQNFITFVKRDPYFPTLLADFFALLDENEKALNWLEHAIDRGNFNYPFFNEHNPSLKNIREEPRFKGLMEKIKPVWENFKL